MKHNFTIIIILQTHLHIAIIVQYVDILVGNKNILFSVLVAKCIPVPVITEATKTLTSFSLKLTHAVNSL